MAEVVTGEKTREALFLLVEDPGVGDRWRQTVALGLL
jgi:hypothetical protein